MMSFMDNWSQSQLPRALGTFSSWVWPGQIFSLESHFPLNISPFFSYGSHYCAQLFLSFHLNQLSLGKDLRFPWCAQVGICSWPRLSVPESNLLNEIMRVPTLCTRQTRERYLSSLFIPEEPRLKLLFCEMEHSFSESMFVSMSPSSPPLLRLTSVPINAKPPSPNVRGGKEAWKL